MEKQNKEMITLNDLRICDNCGNAFSRKLDGEVVNRCPACDVWKKETITGMK